MISIAGNLLDDDVPPTNADVMGEVEAPFCCCVRACILPDQVPAGEVFAVPRGGADSNLKGREQEVVFVMYYVEGEQRLGRNKRIAKNTHLLVAMCV